jgi:uncharacterized RDD family membrane protein YckC
VTTPSDPTPSGSDAGQPPPSPYGQPVPPADPYGPRVPPAGPYGQPAPPAGPYGQPAPPVAGGYGVAPAGGPQIASMVDRLFARIIDAVLLSVAGLIFAIPAIAAVAGSTDPVTGEPSNRAVAVLVVWVVVFVVLTLAYEVVLIAVRGQTVGKQVMKLTVRRAADGALPGWGPSFLRWLVPLGAGLVTSCIGGFGQLLVYLSPFFDNTGLRQGWHDKVAKTVVVKG